jgi:hypothetical protein
VPIAISLFDLDVLTFYLKDPFEFTFYQRQRAATDSYYMPENEIAILAYHLRRRLWKSPATDGESIDGSWAQRIDAHFHAVRRGHPSVKEFEDKVFTHWKNEGFTRLVQQLKQSKIPGFTDAVFQLYEMSSDALDSLIEEIEKTKQKTLKDGKRHSFSCGGGKAGISFVCRPDERMLSQDMYSLAESKKYILHADQWLSLGSIAGSPNLIDVAMYSKEPWKESADLEQLASTLKPGILQRPGGKVGRNDPCKCGSGFKYKKCCGR